MRWTYVFGLLLFISINQGCKKCDCDGEKLRCTSRQSITPPIAESDSITVFCPNAFSPNGLGDKVNDRYFVFATGYTDFNIKIFLAGELVYESDDINEGWDGKYNGQTFATTYNYRVSVKNQMDKTFVLEGDIALLMNGSKAYDCEACRFADQIVPGIGFVNPTVESGYCE